MALNHRLSTKINANAYDAELPSIQKCLIVLGASEREVYYTSHAQSTINKTPWNRRGIYSLGEKALMEWVKELHHTGVKRYREDETAIKCLNIARDRAEHLIEYYFNKGRNQGVIL